MLRALAAHDNVWLASVNDVPPTAAEVQSLQSYCSEVAIFPVSKGIRALRAALSLTRGRSATEGYFWHPALARLLRQWVSRQAFDAVVCYCSGMFRYAMLDEIAHMRLVVDLVDVDSQKWQECASARRAARRALYRLESRRVQALETEIARRASAVTLVSEGERRLYQLVTGDSKAIVVSNGVDLNYFNPNANDRRPEPSTCCFVGVLNYQPNVCGLEWFVKHVWPRVRNAVPHARFIMVGKSPNREIRQLCTAPGVELYGDVPDVRPYLAQSSVAVVPLHIACGVQNKVLEAMAMGKLVIASSAALNGIEAEHGSDLIRADGAAQWTSALIAAFGNQASAHVTGQRARQFVERCHEWNSCLRPFLRLLATDNQERSSLNDLNVTNHRYRQFTAVDRQVEESSRVEA